ncbi:MAG: AAA family ATPase [Cyanobacteria bacterium]|nr:AAA family ATPase [Cyanobacteria bacterium bin.51]
MRLLSARVRDYRLHRDLTVAFDPRFTVIAGPNQSGKSTIAEALHRALFLPVKTGGSLLDAMKSDPFLADPEVELTFSCAGDSWILRKRFAGTRGSVSLQDSGGRSLQGEAAEERLAQLIGTAAVARTRAAAEQLKERWGHLWVWQGSSSDNPLGLPSCSYDHDRLVERLQAGADLGVQSPLDLAVLDDIQRRWAEVFTAGGSNRTPQVRKGSALQLAAAAASAARDDLQDIEDSLQQQQGFQQAFDQAVDIQARIASELPRCSEERQALEGRLRRSRELITRVNQERPVLEGLRKEFDDRVADREQLEQQRKQAAALEAALAPKTRQQADLDSRQRAVEQQRQLARGQLESLRQASSERTALAEGIEQRLRWSRLEQRRQQLASRLRAVVQLQARLASLEKDLAVLPGIDAPAVERLRQRQQALQAARVRAEAMAAGIEVIRAGQPVRLDGDLLATGGTRMLSAMAVLEVGDDVELRLVPGGGTTTAEALQQLEVSGAALSKELARWQLDSVDAAATAERRRSDLLGERERLLEQRGTEDPSSIRQHLDDLLEQIEAHAADFAPAHSNSDSNSTNSNSGLDQDPETLMAQLESDLRIARIARTQALDAEQRQLHVVKQAESALDSIQNALKSAEMALNESRNQLLEARTRIDAVLQRRGSGEALEAEIADLVGRRQRGTAKLSELEAELSALAPEAVECQAQALDQTISSLQQQEREASEARIRAEGKLQGDGQVDRKAELEQKQADLESRLAELERLQKEADMLALLRRLLEEEQNAMASQYAAPLTKRIGAYLAHVFPEAPRASLDYDARSGFRSLQWRRGGEAAFAFELLSTGAREQFAAALRVAMAEVLAEAYDGSLPLVFDDAFAHSDPERQAGVQRMLQEAADRGLQVILLTCDPASTVAIEPAGRVWLGGAGSQML